MNSFYVTTPIYYANGEPHLGHIYTTLVADCLTRYKRQRGFDSFFLTGTDEHGVNIERAAAARNLPVRQHVDEIVDRFKEEFAKLGVEYNRWIRTTDAYHEEGVQNLWRLIKERGYIYKGQYEGWFCSYCNEFKDVEEGVEQPLCPIHERPLDRVAEESYFFKLSEFADRLLELYETRPDFIKPEARRNEVVSFVAGGLKDLSVSRVSVQWGITVPDDPKHTIYVWLDALSNYITALGWGNNQHHDYERYWPVALHLVGKDILRFHTVYWPAFLLAAGLPVPRMVYAHGMWLSGGRRMSKTLGNGIEPEVLHRHFTRDMIRYFVLREMVFGQDGDFTYEALINRVNADLASGLGNLSSRTLTMIHRYANSRIPSPNIAEENYLIAKRAGVDADAQAHATVLEHGRDQFVMHFDDLAFSRALEAAWNAVARTDKLISDAKPWELAKDSQNAAKRETLDAVLYRAAETLRWLAVMLYPVMPEATGAIWRQLGQTETLATCDPTKLTWGQLTEGTRIGEVEPIFPRIDKGKTMTEIEKQAGNSGVDATPVDNAAEAVSATGGGGQARPAVTGATGLGAVPPSPQSDVSGVAPASESLSRANVIEIDDFAKVDLRVGQVLTAERVPKSDKLLRLTVDLGEAEPRQILAGIAEYYEPEPLVGRKIVVVANLKPRKLRGFESQGMVLAASVGEQGRPVLATFTEEVPNGARLK